MTVCDKCKSVANPASQCYVAVQQVDEDAQRATAKTVTRVAIHLCQDCIKSVADVVRKTVVGLKATKPAPEPEPTAV